MWSSAPSKPSHPSLHGSVPALCSNVFLRHCLSGTAASSGFSSFHSGHCSVEWLFQLPQWPFHLQGCPGDVFLTVPRLPPAPSKTSAPSPAASSGFASLSTCTALSLHFAPMSFSGTVSQALQRPLAFLAFTVGTAASSGFSSFHTGHLQGLSQALSLRHCSVQWLFQLPQWPFYLQGSLLSYGSKTAACPLQNLRTLPRSVQRLC